MKRILFLLMILLLTAGKCSRTETWEEIGNGDAMVATSDTLNLRGLDSLIFVNGLSTDFDNDWIKLTTIDPDTRTVFYNYGYIKSISESGELVYNLSTYQDSLYIVTKRITINNPEEDK